MARPLNQISGMPKMGAAFRGWMATVTLKKIIQTVIDGMVIDTETLISFKGVVQPLDPEQINLKPEGQRSFEWLQINCFSGSNNLTTNDRIVYNSIPYKVMGVFDYTQNNYIEYHAVRDYE